MSKTRMTLLVGGTIAAVAMAAGLYFTQFANQPAPVVPPIQKAVIASYVLGYTHNGVVNLYDVQSGKALGNFDLKTLSDKKQGEVVEVITTPAEPTATLTPTPVATTPEPKPEPTPAPKTEPVSDLFKGFAKFPVVIQKGEYAWKIQHDLTPNRDVATMIKLVGEANGERQLHPIYPGERIIFLKEADAQPTATATATPTPEPKPVMEAPKKEEPKPSEVILRKSTKSIDDVPYVFFQDVNGKALYAFSPLDKKVFKISETKGKLDVQTAYQNDQFVNSDKIIVDKEQLLLSEKGSSKVQILNMQNQNIRDIQLEGNADEWILQGDMLYYTFGRNIGKFNLVSGEKASVTVGDQSLEMVALQDKIYVLNRFGEKTNNSLLVKINPADLKVDDFIELKTNDSTILSDGSQDSLLVGRVEKQTDLSGNEVIGSKIAIVNTTNGFGLDSSKWAMPFSKESLVYGTQLYMLQDGKLNIYGMNDVKPSKSLEVQGEHFAILP